MELWIEVALIYEGLFMELVMVNEKFQTEVTIVSKEGIIDQS